MNENVKRTNLTCDEYGLLISLALDNEITPDEQATLSRHLESCDACSARMENFACLNDSVCELGRDAGCNDELPYLLPVKPVKTGATTTSIQAGVHRMRGWWVAASLFVATGMAIVLMTWDSQPKSASADEDIVGPLVELSEINSRRIKDQELLRESLQLDLRTLKLQLYALDDSNQDEVLGRINRLMDRIDQTSMARSDIN